MRERPASPAQDTLFSLSLQATDPSHRLAQLSVSFGESVPVALLSESWEKLAAVHGVLRSSFRKSHGKPMIPTEHDGAKASWRELDWSDIPPTDLAERWAAVLAEESSRPVDPQSPPPIRFLAIGLPGGTTHLLATYPRFLLDEESWFFLLCEWLETLEGRNPEPPEETDPKITSSDCDWEWWKQHLAEIQPSRFRFFGGEAPPNEQHILFGRETTAALSEACKALDATVQNAVFGAWAALLGRLSLSPRALLLSAMDATDQPAATLGSRLNFLPCFFPFDETKPLSMLVREAATLERARQRAGGPSLDTLPLPEDFECRTGNFLAGFSWLPPSLKDRIPDVFPRWINLDARIMDHPVHDLELEARDGNRLSLRIRAASLPPAEVSRLLSGVEQLLLTLISSPETTLRNIKVSGSPSSPIRDGEPSVQPAPIHEIIADAADASPDSNAIEDPDGAVLSYREVDEYATSLAGYLRAGHLGEGWTVSICLTPSPWMPVAILGVLRAGDTCALLDPSAPASWLDAQAVATDTELVICDSGTSDLFEATGKKLLVIDREWDAVSAAAIPKGDPEKPKVAMIFTGTESTPAPPLPQLSPGLLSSACTRSIQTITLEASDRVAVNAAAGTASFASAILCSLATGATAVLCREPGFQSLESSGITCAILTATEFSVWMQMLERNGHPLPTSLRCLVVNARESTVSPAALSTWRQLNEGNCRWISFVSPCDIPGIGLNFILPDGESVDVVPDGQPSRGAGFKFENLAGSQPPFGYPGIASFQPSGIPKPVYEFPAWRDSQGLIYRVPEDPPAAEEKPDTDSKSQPEPTPQSSQAESSATQSSPVEGEIPSPDSKHPENRKPEETHQPPAAQQALKDLGGTKDAPLLVVLDDTPGTPSDYESLTSALGEEWNLVTMPWRLSSGSWKSEVSKIVSAIESGSDGSDIHLLGLRGGGLLALETARHLRTNGREVPYLVIAGASPPIVEKSGWFGALKRSLAAPSKSQHPLQGPCGILLTRDMAPDAEEQWLLAAEDAVVEHIPVLSSELAAKGAPELAKAMKNLGS